jgi:hypothetical protein|tara:strand:- start:95 stop:280 length:186 start_codon:yes stop_codon:yes gene_type:complete
MAATADERLIAELRQALKEIRDGADQTHERIANVSEGTAFYAMLADRALEKINDREGEEEA